MPDPLSQFGFILLAWVILQGLRLRYRAEVLAATGALYVAVFSPVALAFILFTAAEAALLVRLVIGRPRGSPLRKYLAYLVLPNLLFVDFHQALLGFSITILAISFSTIRIFMTAREILAERKPGGPGSYRWIFIAAFYLPAIAIGPVFSGLALRNQQDETVDTGLRNHRLLLQGLVLATIGVAYFHQVSQQPPFAEIVPLTAVVLFLMLFASFWGQSLIAEQSSLFFGYRIPQNFDQPWKATSIKDFWSRWHRSMAGFVMQYIFLPLQLRGVNPKAATVLAFVFMGLWHNVSPGYLLWGLVHGACMAWWPENRYRGIRGRLFGWTGILATWIIVIGMSYIANYSGLSANG